MKWTNWSHVRAEETRGDIVDRRSSRVGRGHQHSEMLMINLIILTGRSNWTLRGF